MGTEKGENCRRSEGKTALNNFLAEAAIIYYTVREGMVRSSRALSSNRIANCLIWQALKIRTRNTLQISPPFVFLSTESSTPRLQFVRLPVFLTTMSGCIYQRLSNESNDKRTASLTRVEHKGDAKRLQHRSGSAIAYGGEL